MRITMVVGQLALGGAEAQAMKVGAALRRAGHDVKVISKRPVHPAVRILDPDLPIKEIFSLGGLRGVGKYAFSASVFAHLALDPPDVIHVHQLVEYHTIPSLLAGLVRGRPVVAKVSGAGESQRNGDLSWLRRRRLVGRLLIQVMARSIDATVAVSNQMRDELLAAGFSPVELIPNGVEPVPLKELTTPTDVVYVGRLDRIKGVDVLLRAWSSIEAEADPSQLVLVGEGPARAELERLAAELRLRRVRFEGSRPDAFSVVDSAVFALPSRAEGLSNALLEAMSRGMPIVATSVGGTCDALEDGISGILVPVDDATAFADALLRVLKWPDMARELGLAARRRAQRVYDIDRIAARYEEIYRKQCAGSQG